MSLVRCSCFNPSVFLTLLYVVAVSVGIFIPGLWGGLGIGGGIILFFWLWFRTRHMPRLPLEISFFAVFALWAVAALNFQSWQSSTSWNELLQLVTIWVPMLLLISAGAKLDIKVDVFFSVLYMALLLTTLLLGIELIAGSPLLKVLYGVDTSPQKYNKGVSYLVMMSFPILAAVWVGASSPPGSNRLVLIGVFLMAMLFPASLTDSRASKLALMLALPVTLFSFYRPVWVRWGLSSLPVFCAAWPFAVQRVFLDRPEWLGRLPDSWRARMEIWDYMSYRILEKPFFGWGVGTSHMLPFQEPHGAHYILTKVNASHPHNMMVQFWVELGVPGVFLGIGFALLMLRQAARLDAKILPFAYGTWIAAFSLCLSAYDFWTDSLWAVFAFAALAFFIVDKRKRVAA